MSLRPLVWIKGKIGLHPEPAPVVDDGRETVALALEDLARNVREKGVQCTWHREPNWDSAWEFRYQRERFEGWFANGWHVVATRGR